MIGRFLRNKQTNNEESFRSRLGSSIKKETGVTTGFAVDTAIFTGFEYAIGGRSATSALTHGVIDAALWRTMPGPFMGYIAATSLPHAGVAVAQTVRDRRDEWNQLHRPNFGGKYRDTDHAYTMRQAAVQAISGSKMNARSAIGGEARLMHRPYRSASQGM